MRINKQPEEGKKGTCPTSHGNLRKLCLPARFSRETQIQRDPFEGLFVVY